MKKTTIIAGLLVAAISIALVQAYPLIVSPQPATTNMMMSGGHMNGSRSNAGSMMNGGHGGSMMGGYGNNGGMMGGYGYGGTHSGYGNGGSMMGGGRSMNHQQWRWMIWHW